MVTTDGSAAERTPDSPLLVRVLRRTGMALVWLGGLTLGFVVHQLFVTTWIAQLQQADLDVELEQRFAQAEITTVDYLPGDVAGVTPSLGRPGAPPEPVEGGSNTGTETPLVLFVESPPAIHEPFARIRIPVIERLVDGWTVVEGVRRDDLRNGAGHMPWTPLPGQPGNAVISGHRTTYGAPFHELDILRAGDRIEVETALGTHVYEVRASFVVRPSDVWVTEPLEGAWLTLTTCNPRFSARERLVVQAELIAGPNAPVVGATA